LQVGDPKLQVSYEIDFDTKTKHSPPDDREIVLVHLVASDFRIVECEDQVTLLPEVLASSNANVSTQESKITETH
jgi:hypothetical protein